MISVTVIEVSGEAGSTIGTGWGLTDDGKRVHFAGDHRAMFALGLAVEDGLDPIVELEDWQVLSIEEGTS